MERDHGHGTVPDVLRVVFHGVRGSTPVHGENTCRYGGNTSCVSVEAQGEEPLVFDLGTGLRYYGHGQAADGTFAGHCLLTHLHWDHIQGLPFFAPMLRDGARLLVHAPVQEDGRTVEEAFRSIVRPPVFPVDIDMLPGRFSFVDVGDDDFALGGYAVSSRFVPHIGNTVGYRVTWKGRSVTYISDHQQPDDGSIVPEGVRSLASGTDVLIHDAQFTPDEYELKRGWGHCTIDYAVSVAEQCGVKMLVLFHHDPAHHDDMLDEIAERYARTASGMTIVVAREGLVLEV